MAETISTASMNRTLAVVIGAGGMGVAISRRLAQRHRVLVADRDAARAEDAASTLREEGGEAAAIACDVTSRESVAALRRHVGEQGGFSVLAHVAGLSPSSGDFATIIGVNLSGPAWVSDALLPLAGPGSVAIMIASLAAHNFSPAADLVAVLRDASDARLADRLREALPEGEVTPSIAYQLSKYGLVMLCRRQAAEWGTRGARIVSLSPGIIDTPMGAREFEQSAGKRRMFALTPLARQGSMLEIADAVEFLASDRASYISGTDLLVDGGLSGAIGTLL